MQVKKFEARSMKEALEMVKTQLGPEAIILNVRDNKKSFGLVGEGSVEITAAISEETLRKKNFVESRIREEDRHKLQKGSARAQRDFIDKMVQQRTPPPQALPKVFRNPTSTRYIDIIDEGSQASQAQSAASQAEARIRDAAQRAWSVFQENGEPARSTKPEAPMQSQQIKALQSEIASLKTVIQKYQTSPQISQNLAQHPGAEFGLNYAMTHTFSKLVKTGVAPEIAAEILGKAQSSIPVAKQNNKAIVDGWAARQILENTFTVPEKNHKKIQIFVGPPGSGKTSTLVKIASNLLIKEKRKIALATLDTRKVGAVDQLRIYAQILNVPFVVIRAKDDWSRVRAQLAGYDQVLVDAPGMSLKSMEEISFLENLLPNQNEEISVHLVMSALSKDSDITEMARRYRSTNYSDVIFTSIDESVEHGHIFNFVYRTKIPLHSFGIGTNVPEDLEYATKERLLDLIFKLTRIRHHTEEVNHAG